MNPSEKIGTLDQVSRWVETARREGKRIVHCHGVFDIIHPGHILHLKEARSFGDLLVVTVTPDRFVGKGPGRPVFNERLRMETLAALEHVDYVGLNEWPSAVETIRRLRPHIYVKGRDYSDKSTDVTGKILEEENAVKSAGGELRFTDTEVFSSSMLANRFFSAYPPETQQYLDSFKKRHSSAEVIEALESLSDLRVLVVGEAILDQYTYCHPLAKSPKEFIVATQFHSEESFAGGTLATANHLAGFCGKVTLVTALGEDRETGGFIRSKMKDNVDFQPVITPGRPTICKRRFLEPGFMTKMFEIQYLKDAPFNESETNLVVSALERRVRECDLVVINDFGHGLFTDPVRRLLAACGKFLAVNTQTNSANLGFNPITRYEHANYACVDEGEARLAAREQHESMLSLGAALREKLRARALMVTRGKDGCLLFTGEAPPLRAPALSVNVVDRIGAGDAFFAITSPCFYRGLDPEVASFIGNCVGALKVAIVCNREAVEPVPLFKFIQHLFK